MNLTRRKFMKWMSVGAAAAAIPASCGTALAKPLGDEIAAISKRISEESTDWPSGVVASVEHKHNQIHASQLAAKMYSRALFQETQRPNAFTAMLRSKL